MRGRRRVGRLLVLGYAGTKPPRELFRFAERFGLGGMILFGHNCPDAATTRASIRWLRDGLADADPGSPALVMVDQEGGRVERIREGMPRLPPALALGREDPASVRGQVHLQAMALAGLGVDVNLAPVCDVLQEGESGAIGDRSFGDDPQVVAELVEAHVRATSEGGILACAKHFPGHGAARVDSHRDLPRIARDMAAFEAVDLVPFRAAIRAGVPMVMAAHLLCPAVSPLPAVLCPVWLGQVLRSRLGFRGAVISDDMEMGALAALGEPSDVACQAVEAGCDLLIYGRMLRPGLDLVAVAEALQDRLPGDRVQTALGRTAALREALS